MGAKSEPTAPMTPPTPGVVARLRELTEQRRMELDYDEPSGGWPWGRQYHRQGGYCAEDAYHDEVNAVLPALLAVAEAAAAVLENGGPPFSWPVNAARNLRDALAALNDPTREDPNHG